MNSDKAKLPHLTQLHEIVAVSASSCGSRPALAARQAVLDYSSLWDEVTAFGSGLNGGEPANGERVAVYLDKRPETVIAIFGASAAGGVVVPVNPALRARQVSHILTDCEVGVLVTSPDRLKSIENKIANCTALRLIVLTEPDEVSIPASIEVRAWQDNLGDGRLPETGRIDIDPAAIFYTSGSTGKPKGVVVSHRNLIAGAESVNQYLANGPEDRILALLPLSFDAGFSQL